MKVNNLKNQHGIATVLIVLLVGVALSASTLGVIYSVKSTQSKQVTSHASTNAQAAAWALAEAGRAYLSGLSPAELTSLKTAIDTAIAEGMQGYELTLAYPDTLAHLRQSKIIASFIPDISGKPAYELNITAIDTASKASTKLNVVFEVVPGSPGRLCYPEAENRFTGDVLGDSVDFYMTGERNEVVVDGSYGSKDTLHSVHGIGKFRVTGNLGLEGTTDGTPLTDVQANGNVNIKIASADIRNVTAGGNIVLDASPQGLSVGNIIAGGNITWYNHNGSSGNMQAGVKISGPLKTKDEDGAPLNVELDVDGYRVSPVNAGEPLGAIIFEKDSTLHKKLLSRENLTLRGNLTVNNAYSLSNILFNGYGKDITSAAAADSIICTGSKPTLTDGSTLTAGVAITNCNDALDVSGLTQKEIVKADVEKEMVPYVPLDLPPSLIADADNYNANYSFHAVGVSHEIQVTVSNVNGLVPGVYTLDYENHGNELVKDGAATGFNICGNTTERCIFFDDKGELVPNEADRALRTTADDRNVVEARVPEGLWTISADTKVLAPGVYYFDRDILFMGANANDGSPTVGVFINSILSAGSIRTSNPIRLFAMNGAPDYALCGNQEFNVISAQHSGLVTFKDKLTGEFFPEQSGYPYPYPTNYCEVGTGGAVQRIAGGVDDYIGQFGLMAGQENHTVDKEGNEVPVTYQGGNIYFASSFEVYGRVIAGNAIKLIEVNGNRANVEIFGLVGSEARGQGINGTQNNLNGTIDVNTDYMDILDKGVNTGDDCTPNTAVTPQSKLIWSRYL